MRHFIELSDLIPKSLTQTLSQEVVAKMQAVWVAMHLLSASKLVFLLYYQRFQSNYTYDLFL